MKFPSFITALSFGVLLIGSVLLLMNKEAAWHVLSDSFSSKKSTLSGAHAASISIATNPDFVASKEVPTKTGSPIKLLVPSLDIDLPITAGTYNEASKTWTLSQDKVQYATITPSPNNKGGNTFMYGHNSHQLLARMQEIKSNQYAYVLTDNGLTFSYKFINSKEVSPSDTELFKYSGAPILTIQTCSGSFYQNRQLFSFQFISVN